jgi:hypothetical protein
MGRLHTTTGDALVVAFILFGSKVLGIWIKFQSNLTPRKRGIRMEWSGFIIIDEEAIQRAVECINEDLGLFLIDTIKTKNVKRTCDFQPCDRFFLNYPPNFERAALSGTLFSNLLAGSPLLDF